MSEYSDLVQRLAGLIADYRAGEIPQPDGEHVERWLSQFDEGARLPLLAEITHVLEKTYFSRAEVDDFLGAVVLDQKLAGDDPPSFWRSVQFLDIQGGGRSQQEMIMRIDAVMHDRLGMSVPECGSEPVRFIYLDDGVWSGNRVRADLSQWSRNGAPHDAVVHIVVLALHRGGQWYASNGIQEAAGEAGRELGLTWWRGLELEDRKAYITQSDVLRPVTLPDDDQTRAYVETLRHPVALRTGSSLGQAALFSSPEGRNLLEQEFLRAGVRIRQMAPLLGPYQRPLGNMVLDTLGFGSLVVTFRNCPNNAPLALWAGDPWYPLFPRVTN